MTRERFASLPQGDWRRNARWFQEPMFSKAQFLVEHLRAIGEKHGRRPGEVAIAWTLRQPAITATIVGARKPQQVDELIGAATFRLSAREAEQLDAAAAEFEATAQTR
jgi:aryl-alcohol dehydrogenase-like predicted oxidoreductase